MFNLSQNEINQQIIKKIIELLYLLEFKIIIKQ